MSIHPVIEASGGEGLDEAALRSSQIINMGDEFQIEAGAQQVMARFSQNSPNTIMAALPFATVAWRGGNSTVGYRMATVPPVDSRMSHRSRYYMPRIAMRGSELALEHGMHQEFGWERRTDDSGVTFLVFADRIKNPVIEAAGDAVNGSRRRVDRSCDRVDARRRSELFERGLCCSRRAPLAWR